MEKVDFMTKRNSPYRILRFMLAMILGVFLSAFACGASTVQAAETANEAQAAGDDTAEDGSETVIILLGAMLLIIIAVVLSVIGTVISTVASVEAGDEA